LQNELILAEVHKLLNHWLEDENRQEVLFSFCEYCLTAADFCDATVAAKSSIHSSRGDASGLYSPLLGETLLHLLIAS